MIQMKTVTCSFNKFVNIINLNCNVEPTTLPGY